LQDLIKELEKITGELAKESDRGSVLVIGSWVESVLEDQIKIRLLGALNKKDELFSNHGIASTFDAKIILAFRLGIIKKKEHDIYNLLRKLRNKCAHEITEKEYDSNLFHSYILNIADITSELWEIIRTKLVPVHLKGQVFESNKDYAEALGWRQAFELFFGLIISHKLVTKDRVIPLKPLY